MEKRTIDRKKVGELLLDQELITQKQLDEALKLQKTMPDQTIGQLLCRMGYVREADLRLLLDQNDKRFDLREILLQDGLVTKKNLHLADELVRQHRIPLEAALLRLRLVDEEQLAQAVATQYDLPYVQINREDVDIALAKHIGAAFARKHRIAPLSRIGNTLTVAMAKAFKQNSIRELEDIIRQRIIAVIASESSIRLAHQLLYGPADEPSGGMSEEQTLNVLPDSIVDLLSETVVDEEPEVEEESRKVTERDNVIVKLVNKIIYDAYVNKASDIHIEPSPGKRDVVVRTRIDGQCVVYESIPYKYKFALPSRIKIMAELDIAERRKPQDGKIEYKKFGPLDIELRVATMPTAGGLEDVVIRILSTSGPLAFKDLGLTARNRTVFEESVRSPHGLVLVVGPTGSGKTTTLHSALALINEPSRKIWTAEDPVEITQPGLRQVQVNPRIGFTFATALRSFLRLDPDVIMVGEMRDVETSKIALEASLTGHLVFSTLHTNSAAETVTRLLEIGLDPFSFSDSLVCILAQRLVRRLCDRCKEVYQPSAEELEELIEEYGQEAFAATGLVREDVRIARPTGCENCRRSGYRGRLGVHEVLGCSQDVKKLIKRRGDTDSIRETAVAEGMTSLKQDGLIKVFHGLTDLQEVRRVCIS